MLILLVKVRGNGGEGVELAVQLCDLVFSLAELSTEGADVLVPADFARCPQDLAGNLGIPFGEDVVGAVDSRMADLGLAGESLVRALSVWRGSPASSRAMASRSLVAVLADTGIRG
ncbi:hypothetical protein [Streptomyces parvulus]|uniref:hypothetical protein n=1 Tax=Streptomyces parvulus TaxID=146923 RepID=UPI001CF9A6A7|nr:hypothetical protein [Streptomyces parvulus]